MSTYNDYMEFLDDYTGRSDAKAYIDARIKLANTELGNAETRLTTADNGIQYALNTMDTSDYGDDIPDFSDIEDADFDADVLRNQDTPDAPTWVPAPLDITVGAVDEWDIGDLSTAPTKPGLSPVDITKLSEAVAPNSDTVVGLPPTDEFLYTPVEYVSTLADFLGASIKTALDEINNDSDITVFSNVELDGNTTGIALVDNDIEEAIYDRAFSRTRVEEAREVEQTEEAFQARGFSLPPGALSAAVSNIRNNSARTMADVNRDVVVSRIELEQKRTEYELKKAEQVTDAQFKHDTIIVALEEANVKYKEATARNLGIYIDAGTKLEDILSKIHMLEEEQRFESEKVSYDSIFKVYELKISLFKELMQAYLVETEAAVATVKAETEYNSLLIDIFSKEMQAWGIEIEGEKLKIEGTKVNAEISQIQLTADIEKAKAENDRYMVNAQEFESEVKAYAALMDGLKTAETLDLQRYDIETRARASEVTSLTQKATMQIEQAMKMAALSIEALKSQTSISGSIISASLNAMNTSAAFGFSGGASQSHTSSTNKALNVGYSWSGLSEDLDSPYVNINERESSDD